MITDKESNFVYLSNLLQDKCPDVFEQLTFWFEKYNIKHAMLSNTKDLWAVDYMPLQLSTNRFVQFRYAPDYLTPKIHQITKTDSAKVYGELGINPECVDITIDGGNVVKCANKVILTCKIFKENPTVLEHDLVNCIANALQVKQVIIIPQEPKDFVGHADGMLRFINKETVLINKYPNQKPYQDFGYIFRWSLRNAGIHYVEFPYESWKNVDPNDATGCYINFLEIQNFIFYPVYGLATDQSALIQLQKVFSGREFIGIDCRELAKLGGVLNCATWNIKI
ncbi:agmatine deiminase family protein [Mucilaginibacter sp. HD30]